jgi:acetyl-CoA carboxylase carboxyl transferase subunit alpha
VGAEERGQSEAIARNLREMARLRTPIVASVIGEGGSGGALGIGVGDQILMLQYATYSVISPEGCASILWRDGAKGPEAAEQLKLLADNVRELGIADRVVDEPLGGAHRDAEGAAQNLEEALAEELDALDRLDPDTLVEARYRKFRAIGQFQEPETQPA